MSWANSSLGLRGHNLDDHAMTDDLHAMLLAWLESGTDAQKHHAAYRLAQPDANRKYPSIFQQAVNAARAVSSVVASVVHGEAVTVPQEEQDRRLAICHQCEFWDAAQKRCSKCGCFGQWKTWLASQQCPIGKW